ncbi:MAG: PAS domain S-box protein [Candidatus Thiodiazotropha taylori]|nr:PAS domain S-box protein [Candidatus Thiodiazotropha taylori]MCG7971492.1 PAS domain S-box protein [Candidatus Thiodiazotropha taylori]
MSIPEHYLKAELDKLVQTDPAIFSFIEHATLDGLWYWDLEDPEIEWMNKDFWSLFGYSSEEKKHLASEWQDMIFSEDLSVALDNFNRHLEDPSHPYDQLVRYRHKNGSTVWVRCRGLAIRDKSGKPIRMLGAHNDMTKAMQTQYRLQNALEELQDKNQDISNALARYRQLYENMHDGFAVTNLEGDIQEANTAYLSMIGYTMEELKGKNYRELTVNQEEFSRQDNINRQSLTERGYSDWFEADYTHKEGHQIPVQIRVHRVTDYFDGEDGIWAIIIDLSERKRLEKQRQLEEQMLFHSAKLASMGEMVTAIAHQWRQPLNVLSGVLSNIQDAHAHKTLSNSYLADLIKMADHHLQYMSNTINDFRDFLKPSPASSHFNLIDALESAKKIASAQLDSNQIVLDVASSCTSITLNGSISEFVQVLISLINNAKDAIVSRKKIQLISGIIKIYCETDNEKLSVLVKDNGGGIEKHLEERIFEPYFTTKEEQENAGIGLYLAKVIIERKFSSTLTIANTSDEETTFRISLTPDIWEKS